MMLEQLGTKLWALLSSRPGLCLESAQAMQYRWMLEELRVSFFAQSLGTQLAVSERRLQEQWSGLELWLRQNPH